jgi:hypothetical protein
MAPKIYSSKEPLDLNRLRLSKPTTRNGTHFIKMADIDNPIYMLGPKCTVKNGFVKSGKKVFCDFVFGNEDAELLEWLGNLEEKAQQLIFENRATWFETPLDEHDIESSMSSPYKPYKSGKCFIIRVNVPTALDKINVKVYDENEQETDTESIKENTKVLAVLEFQGIRCSVRSFQFEIELKQLLIVEPEKIFETCIISKVHSSARQESEPEPEPTLNTQEPENILPIHSDSNEPILKQVTDTDLFETSNLEEIKSLNETEDVTEIMDIPFETNIDVEPPLQLKNRNDVYYKLYKDLRQRAKEAKREALANYLEAKRIKNVYLLEDVSDSDSDEDNLEKTI